MAKHKCKIPEPPPDTTRWLGTYGDMVTLLMAFFVMLFAVSETSNQKFVAFVSGLAGPFDNASIDLGLVEGGTPAGNISPISLMAPPSRPGDTADAGEASRITEREAEQIREHEAAQAQLSGVDEALEQALEQAREQAQGASEVPIQVDLRDDQRGLVVSISTNEVLFPVGSADIAPAGRELLAQIAPILAAAPNTLVVEGHTDDTPLNDAGYSNWNLSTDRAVAVVELLGEAHGISYDRISAAGYGENRPLVPNDSDANRSINRRVEILIVGLDISRDGAPPPPSGPQTAAPPGGTSPAPPPSSGAVVAVPIDPGITETLPRQDDVAAAGPANAATLASIMGHPQG